MIYETQSDVTVMFSTLGSTARAWVCVDEHRLVKGVIKYTNGYLLYCWQRGAAETGEPYPTAIQAFRAVLEWAGFAPDIAAAFAAQLALCSDTWPAEFLPYVLR